MPANRFACSDDIPAILKIWESGFPEDGETTAEAFLKTVDLGTECLVAEEDGVPVSMVFLLPCELCDGENRWPVQYIYAAATLEAYRGRGIFAGLLETALEIGKARGQAGSFLRPAEPGLAAYYGRFGYEPFFYTDTHYASLPGWLEANSTTPSAAMEEAAEYTVLREQCLAGIPLYISWPERFAAYAAVSARQAGGRAAAFRFPEGPGCALYDRAGDTLLVRELLCPPGRETSCLSAIAREQPWGTMRWRTPALDIRASGVFGLWKPFATGTAEIRMSGVDRPPYMGLALD